MGATFKAACVQNCAIDDLAANLVTAERLVRDAAAAGANLICLPEFFSNLERSEGAYFDKGYSADEHPAVQLFGKVGDELQAWILLGSIPIKHRDRTVHNRSFLLAPGGKVVATYDKIHLFDVAIKDGQNYKESSSVAPGEQAVIGSLPWGSLGLTICYDVRFPQLYRQLAKAGADFISIPAAFTAKTGAAHWHTLVRARAIETGCYVFAPGQCGVRPWGRQTYGHSLIVDPWGAILADGGDDEGFVIADIDPSRVADARSMIPSLSHDRAIAGPNQ